MNPSRSPSAPTRRRAKVTISDACLPHLENLAEGAYKRDPDLADRLLEELSRARVVSAQKLPSNVVTIDRAVTYLDETSGEEKSVTPVYPEHADIERGRISVLTPIGVALIGLTEGASLPWKTRGGEVRQLKILRVGDNVTTNATSAAP